MVTMWHLPKYVTCISSFNLYKNQVDSTIFPILQIGTKRLSDLPRVTLLVTC